MSTCVTRKTHFRHFSMFEVSVGTLIGSSPTNNKIYRDGSTWLGFSNNLSLIKIGVPGKY